MGSDEAFEVGVRTISSREVHDLVAGLNAFVPEIRAVAIEQRAYEPDFWATLVLEVSLQLPEEVLGAVLATAVGWARKKWMERGRPREVIIYGPHSEVLRRVRVDASDVEEPESR
jgi:hypothetical protein